MGDMNSQIFRCAGGEGEAAAAPIPARDTSDGDGSLAKAPRVTHTQNFASSPPAMSLLAPFPPLHHRLRTFHAVYSTPLSTVDGVPPGGEPEALIAVRRPAVNPRWESVGAAGGLSCPGAPLSPSPMHFPAVACAAQGLRCPRGLPGSMPTLSRRVKTLRRLPTPHPGVDIDLLPTRYVEPRDAIRARVQAPALPLALPEPPAVESESARPSASPASVSRSVDSVSVSSCASAASPTQAARHLASVEPRSLPSVRCRILCVVVLHSGCRGGGVFPRVRVRPLVILRGCVCACVLGRRRGGPPVAPTAGPLPQILSCVCALRLWQPASLPPLCVRPPPPCSRMCAQFLWACDGVGVCV